MACGQNTELRLAGAVGITGRVSDFNETRWMIELEVARSMGGKRIDLFLGVRLEIIANGGKDE